MPSLLKPLAATFAVLVFAPPPASAGTWPPLDCEDICDWTTPRSEYRSDEDSWDAERAAASEG